MPSRSRFLYFHPHHGLVAVKQGFSWPAFFFGSLWALARRLYLLFVLLFLPEAVLWFLTGYAGAQHSLVLLLVGLLLTVALAVVRGKYGNRWLRSYLLSRGYSQHN